MVLSTLFETGGCVCVCVCVCMCMCDGGKGRPEFCCFLESGVLSLPPGGGLVIALTKRGGLSALEKQYFITNLK